MNYTHWDWQTGATWAAIFATFGLGAWNLFVGLEGTKKTRFINTVTNQRVLWIEKLREDLAQFLSLAAIMAADTTRGRPVATAKDNRIALNRLRRVITLRLNPADAEDQKIQALLPTIVGLAFDGDRKGLVDAHLNTLADLSQKMLKLEWDKVKLEAENGRLNIAKVKPKAPSEVPATTATE